MAKKASGPASGHASANQAFMTVAKDGSIKILSDHQFILNRAKPLLDEATQQARAQAAQRGRPLSRKQLISQLRNTHAETLREMERRRNSIGLREFEQQRAAVSAAAVKASGILSQTEFLDLMLQKETAGQQIDDEARETLLDNLRETHALKLREMSQQRAAVSAAAIKAAGLQSEGEFLDEEADKMLAQQHEAERGRKQQQEEVRLAILETVRRESKADLKKLARLREKEEKRLAEQKKLAREAEQQASAAAGPKPVRVAARAVAQDIPSDIAFLRQLAAPLIEAAEARGETINKPRLMARLRHENADKLDELQVQRLQRKLDDPNYIATDLEFLTLKAAPVIRERQVALNAANEEAEAIRAAEKKKAEQEGRPLAPEFTKPLQRRVNKGAVLLEMREQFADDLLVLQQRREEAEAQAEAAAPKRATPALRQAKPVKQLTAEELAEREAVRLAREAAEQAARAAAMQQKLNRLGRRHANKQAKPEKPTNAVQPSELTRRAREVQAEDIALGRPARSLADIKAYLRQQDVRAQRIAREAEERAAEDERIRRRNLNRQMEADRAARPAPAVTEEVVEDAPARIDPRKQRREQNKAPDPTSGFTVQDWLQATQAHLAERQFARANAAAEQCCSKTSSTDPLRLQLARIFVQLKRPLRAIELLEPLTMVEATADEAISQTAQCLLAEGDSIDALSVMNKAGRQHLAPLRAATQLSVGIRTDDADMVDEALQQLDKARFISDGRGLYLGLDAYAGMPAELRLSARELNYANTLGEGLTRNKRYFEAARLYDSLRVPAPTCAEERRNIQRALKSSGQAYYHYGLECRAALGQLSVPHSPTQGWSTQRERSGLSTEATTYLNRAFGQLFRAFELHSSDVDLRQQLAQVVQLTGNPNHVQQLNDRLHRRERALHKLDRLASAEGQALSILASQREQGKLLPEDNHRLRELEGEAATLARSREETARPSGDGPAMVHNQLVRPAQMTAHEYERRLRQLEEATLLILRRQDVAGCLSPEEKQIFDHLDREDRRAKRQASQTQQNVLKTLETVREVSDKPAHMPSARQRRVYRVYSV